MILVTWILEKLSNNPAPFMIIFFFFLAQSGGFFFTFLRSAKCPAGTFKIWREIYSSGNETERRKQEQEMVHQLEK
jgi:hypothetical protein